MSMLPGRPNLDQLRHQARDLHRAATGGDADSVRRVQAVSASLTLSAAQLAIAREYGFASWAKLRAEVTNRRAAAGADADTELPAGDAGAGRPAGDAGPGRPAADAAPDNSPRSWREMREWCARLLQSRTGQDVAAWTERIAAAGLADERALREWLTAEGVTGYPQTLLVWERFGYPEFLIADAEDLIDKQYADRPGLRPILDAVLAALAALGPVTVQARGTYVSLVSPRRTFAVVQAATKSRVDLGLRLTEMTPGGQPADAAPGGQLTPGGQLAPGGRLREAKNLGQANTRISLSSPDEVDDEVLGWLRRAYEQNTAPPPRPRPARRQASKLGPLTVVVEGTELPGRSFADRPDRPTYHNVHVALYTKAKDLPTLAMPGNPWQATQPVPGDATAARWQLAVTVRHGDDGYDFSGPFVRGPRDDRHLGLAWGVPLGDGTFWLFRGAKLRLVDVPDGVIEAAMRPGHHLVAQVRLTGDKGGPVCARVGPSHLTWSAEPDAP